MKILALAFLLFGIAAAFSHEDLELATDEAILSFLHGMEKAPSLKAMDMDLPEFNEVEEEVKTELVKALRDALETLLKRIKEAVDHGKLVKEEMKEHVEKIKGELKKLGKSIGDKAKELLEKLKEKTKGKLKEWFEKLRKGGSEYSEGYEIASAEPSLREVIERIREVVVKILVENLKEETMEKFKEILDKMIGGRSTRDAKSIFEKVKDYLKEVKEDFQHRFSSFLDWLENVYKSGADAAKGRIENVKKVAQKFLEHVREVGKKTADEALDFFRPYRKDLGTLWDQLQKAIKEAYGKH